jgi:glycerol-3-phosphate dehydrogenase (NAD(P)+)
LKVAVLGAGAWGTALALVLHRRLHDVVLWGHSPGHLEELRQSGRNERYLPGIELPRGWVFETALDQAVRDCDAVVVAMPSKVVRTATRALLDYTGIIVSVVKGIEYDTGLTMCGVLSANAPRARIAALSGPTLALEVARGVPSAIVAASTDAEAAQIVQQMFHGPTFRVYTTNRSRGRGVGWSLKECRGSCRRRR